MERAGVAPTGRTLPHTQEAWFADKRTMPQATTHYLNRLGKLRDQLIHQESENLNRSLDRFREQTYNRNQVQTNVMQRQGAFTVHKEVDGPRKHKKAQLDKQQRMDKARKGRIPPKLDPLQGERLIDTTVPEGVGSVSSPPSSQDPNSLYASYDNVGELLVSEQAAKVDLKNLHRSLRPQQSIPNVHRKAHKQTEPLMLYTDESENDPGPSARSDTFVRQMALHQKTQKGLYKGNKRRQLLRGDDDEVDLYPETFPFDIPDSHDGSEMDHEAGRSNGYYVPSTSPIEWDRTDPNGIKYKLPRYKDVHRPAPPPVTMRGVPTKPTWPSLRVPIQNNVNITRQNVKEYEKHTQKHTNGVRRRSCMFCTQPNISQQLDYILFSRTQTTVDQKEPRSPSLPPGTVINRIGQDGQEFVNGDVVVDEDIVTTNSLRATAIPEVPSLDVIDTVLHANQPDGVSAQPSRREVDSPRKRLVIEMPNIMLSAPTPQGNPSPEQTEAKSQLFKETRQNRLREKEVGALIEDLKDLSKVEQDLKVQAGEGEDSVIWWIQIDWIPSIAYIHGNINIGSSIVSKIRMVENSGLQSSCEGKGILLYYYEFQY